LSTALKRIAVGVVVERRKATSPWIDFVWQPTSVLVGETDAQPWSLLGETGTTATFYVGLAEIALHRTETTNYRDNLNAATPSLWVTLRPTAGDPPYTIVAVTGDPAEGEAYTEAGNDLVEAVPMPEEIQDQVAAFVAEHHVERQVFKRKRERADPEALGRRPVREGGHE
jgi:hypothetical protein